MIYHRFGDLSLSSLGFGTMRLPCRPDRSVDEEQVFSMMDEAISGGVNYFDTAYPYHGGMSEIVIGRALARYPRESYYLASKYPGHQIAETYYPEEIFEQQLKKCGVEYFDFYLLHNVYEKSFDVYCDPRWGIVDYFVEQKRRGRIRHLGFSSHGRTENLRAFLDRYGSEMEFCQIQLNYLDWTLQQAKEKVALLGERNIPIIVMEPLRGGRLASPSPEAAEKLAAIRPGETPAETAFRFLQSVPGVLVTLSGMSALSQMRENIRVFSEEKPLTKAEQTALFAVAESMKNSLPCTGCRYCTDGCPLGLDIPTIIATYNDARFGGKTGSLTAAMQMEALPPEKHPSACIGCGACAAVCPQKIDVPGAMREFAAQLKNDLPHWAEMCREREAAARRLAGK